LSYKDQEGGKNKYGKEINQTSCFMKTVDIIAGKNGKRTKINIGHVRVYEIEKDGVKQKHGANPNSHLFVSIDSKKQFVKKYQSYYCGDHR
jgi:hypothetical protein